jgi:hypothetical protein
VAWKINSGVKSLSEMSILILAGCLFDAISPARQKYAKRETVLSQFLFDI